MLTCAEDVRTTLGFRHGAYFCLRLSAGARSALNDSNVPRLAADLELTNEFEPGADHPARAIAYLRRVNATAGATVDVGLADAEAVIHVAADEPEPVAAIRAEFERRMPPGTMRILSGVVRPPNFTGIAMHNFAYAHRVLQHSGTRMPNAFLMPMSKTEAWWAKSWMERHTYFLPRYGDSGEMVSEGHALVCEPGIACILRRTYRQEREPAAPGTYDFVNYFECADADLPAFQSVCAGLRDVKRNPEWRYVLEGPVWHGRRVAQFTELL